MLDGTTIGRGMQRHLHSEFIRFLNAVERDVPAGKLIHTVLDNYAAHNHPKVLAWLARYPPTKSPLNSTVSVSIYLFEPVHQVTRSGRGGSRIPAISITDRLRALNRVFTKTLDPLEVVNLNDQWSTFLKSKVIRCGVSEIRTLNEWLSLFRGVQVALYKCVS